MEITLKNLQKKIPIPKSKILEATKKRSLIPFFRDLYCLSIVFVGTKRMRAVNKKYLKHDYVTDVLTFKLSADQAEIIICPQVALSNAKAHKTSTEKEIILYVIHGLLHLAGYDDHKSKDILQMRRLENKLLNNSLQGEGIKRIS